MILCAGCTLIDCIVSESGSEAVADDIALSIGGEAFNEAVTLKRLGDPVMLSAPVGNDFAGAAIRTVLQQEGVLLAGSYPGRTPVSLLTVNSQGERQSRVSRVHDLPGFVPAFPDAAPRTSSGSPEPPLPEAALQAVTMASLFRPPFLDPDACLAFARKARSIPNVLLLADTKLPKGTSPKLADYRDTLALLDYITPNEQEALYYTGRSSVEDAAAVLSSFGVRNVIIKEGSKGCYCLPAGGAGFHVPSISVDCVDTVGAGDAFAAGLLHELLRGVPLPEALRFASACGALSTTARGAAGAIRSEAQISRLLAAMSENAAVYAAEREERR